MSKIVTLKNFMPPKDKSIINYGKGQGRIFIEQEYLPQLEGRVLFVGVNYYNEFYYLLARDPHAFETLDCVEERKQFGSPFTHHVGNLLDFNRGRHSYDHVCCFGMLGHADDWEILKEKEEVLACVSLLSDLVKPEGTLLLGPACSQTEFNFDFWNDLYNTMCTDQYEPLLQKRIDINYILWAKKTN